MSYTPGSGGANGVAAVMQRVSGATRPPNRPPAPRNPQERSLLLISAFLLVVICLTVSVALVVWLAERSADASAQPAATSTAAAPTSAPATTTTRKLPPALMPTARATTTARTSTSTTSAAPTTTAAPADTLDQAAVEIGVLRVLTRTYDVDDVQDVQCPAGQVIEVGAIFSCTVTTGTASQTVPVTILDTSGAYEVGRPQ